ncbi:MAG: hypothetical protein ABIL49_05045 [candidate division WOR-3 bacterium]|jgi:hypothetical protein
MIIFISYIVGNIEVITKNIFESEKGFYKFVDKFHIKTKPFVIYNIIPLKRGMYITDTSIISDIKSRLISTNLFYSVDIEYEIINDTINLKIITRDVWTLGIYTNIEGSGNEGKIDVGFYDLNFLGLGIYTLLSITNSSEYRGFEGGLESSSIIKQNSIGFYPRITNLEKDFYFYISRSSWRSIKSLSYYFWINRDSYEDKVFNVIGLNVGYNFKAPKNEPFIGFRLFENNFTLTIGHNISNTKPKFLKNINNFIREEFFNDGFKNYTALGYNFFNLTTELSIIRNNVLSILKSEFENNPSQQYIILSNKLYYKPLTFITFAIYNEFKYMDIKDTTSIKGFRVGGIIGIRGLNYFEGFSNKIYRFSIELRSYSNEIFQLFAFGPVIFYDFAYYGNKISVYGIGLRLQLTRFSAPVIRIDYANNGILSFSAGQSF